MSLVATFLCLGIPLPATSLLHEPYLTAAGLGLLGVMFKLSGNAGKAKTEVNFDKDVEGSSLKSLGIFSDHIV